MFTLEVLNGFEMIQRMASVEVPATHAGHRAFIGVDPPLPDKGVDQWRVRRFEIPEELMEANFCELDLVDSHFVRLDTLAEVEELLAKWKIDSSKFKAPWHCDYRL